MQDPEQRVSCRSHPHALPSTTHPPQVVKASCYALEVFCFELTEDMIKPFVDEIVARLSAVLSVGQDKDLTEMALSALSSTASAAGSKFTAHAPVLLPALISYMNRNEPEYILLR